MEKLGEGDLEKNGEKWGESLQNGMYSWFLKRKRRKKAIGTPRPLKEPMPF